MKSSSSSLFNAGLNAIGCWWVWEFGATKHEACFVLANGVLNINIPPQRHFLTGIAVTARRKSCFSTCASKKVFRRDRCCVGEGRAALLGGPPGWREGASEPGGFKARQGSLFVSSRARLPSRLYIKQTIVDEKQFFQPIQCRFKRYRVLVGVGVWCY